MKRDKTIEWKRVDGASLDLKGMRTIIVGGTGGIGRALSRFMASRGACVVVVGQTFRDGDISGIQFIKADLSLMHEAERVAAGLPVETADLLIFTTGIFATPKRQETSEGIERDMAISYLSRLVIVRKITGRLGIGRPAAAPKPRVFIMGFPGAGQKGNDKDLNAEQSYKSMSVHMNTVAGNEMLVLDGAKRYPGINFFGLNPGVMSTNIRSNLFGDSSLKFRVVEWLIRLIAISPDKYAERLAGLIVSPDIEAHSGAMFNQKGLAILPSSGLTESHINLFMTASDILLFRANIDLDKK